MNGHARSGSEAQHIHDAEAFELEGLISDEEDGREAGERRSSTAQHRRHNENDEDEGEDSLMKETGASRG